MKKTVQLHNYNKWDNVFKVYYLKVGMKNRGGFLIIKKKKEKKSLYMIKPMLYKEKFNLKILYTQHETH